MPKILAVTTTVATEEDAVAMSRAVVERRLAACAQIERIRSFFRWQGAVQEEPEFRILFKTTEDRYPALQEAIRALHKYDVPVIHAVEAVQAFEPYARWVAENSDGAG